MTVEHLILELRGEYKPGDINFGVLSREMLCKVAGLDEITGNACTQRRRPRIEHKGTPSFKGWQEGDPSERGEEPGGRGDPENK